MKPGITHIDELIQLVTDTIANFGAEKLTLSSPSKNALIIKGERERKMSASVFEVLLETLSEHFTITELSLKHNWISLQDLGAQERVFKSIPPTVTHLNILNDYFSHFCSFDRMHKSKFNLTTLGVIPATVKELNLSANDLGYTYSEPLPHLGKAIPRTVESLILAGNHLGETYKPGYLIPFMQQLTFLEKLDLYQNGLHQLSIHVLVGMLKALGTSKSLRELNLGGNHLHTLEANDIALFIMALPVTLQSLNLTGAGTYPQIAAVKPIREEIPNFIYSLPAEKRIAVIAHYIIESVRHRRSRKDGASDNQPFVSFKFNPIKISNEDVEPILDYFEQQGTAIASFAHGYLRYIQHEKQTQSSGFFQPTRLITIIEAYEQLNIELERGSPVAINH